MEHVTYQRKEHNRNQILELLHQCDRETVIMGDDQTGDKST